MLINVDMKIYTKSKGEAMADRYYWGKPRDVIKWYLRGILHLSAASKQHYIEKTGAEQGNLPRHLKLLEELDKLFETVGTDSIALLCLRYVELLSIPDTAERTGLSNSQISTRTAKVMKKAKEIIVKAWYKTKNLKGYVIILVKKSVFKAHCSALFILLNIKIVLHVILLYGRIRGGKYNSHWVQKKQVIDDIKRIVSTSPSFGNLNGFFFYLNRPPGRFYFVKNKFNIKYQIL